MHCTVRRRSAQSRTRVGQVVQPFEQQEDVEAPVGNRQLLRIHTGHADAIGSVRGRPLCQLVVEISADHPLGGLGEMLESYTGAARNLEHIFSVGQLAGDTVARMQHRDLFGSRALPRDLGNDGVLARHRGPFTLAVCQIARNWERDRPHH